MMDWILETELHIPVWTLIPSVIGTLVAFVRIIALPELLPSLESKLLALLWGLGSPVFVLFWILGTIRKWVRTGYIGYLDVRVPEETAGDREGQVGRISEQDLDGWPLDPQTEANFHRLWNEAWGEDVADYPLGDVDHRPKPVPGKVDGD